jgi:hypothetical protein
MSPIRDQRAYDLELEQLNRRHTEERLRLNDSADKMRRELEPTIKEARNSLADRQMREWYELREQHGIRLGPAAKRALKGGR